MDDVSSGTGGQEGCELVQLEACAVMQQDDAGYLTLNDVSDYVLALLTSQSPQSPDLEHVIHAAQRRLVIVARLSVHSPAASCNALFPTHLCTLWLLHVTPSFPHICALSGCFM